MCVSTHSAYTFHVKYYCNDASTNQLQVAIFSWFRGRLHDPGYRDDCSARCYIRRAEDCSECKLYPFIYAYHFDKFKFIILNKLISSFAYCHNVVNFETKNVLF